MSESLLEPQLDFIRPRLVMGGIIVLDDYGSDAWPGVAAAAQGYDVTVLVPNKQSMVMRYQ